MSIVFVLVVASIFGPVFLLILAVLLSVSVCVHYLHERHITDDTFEIYKLPFSS